VTPDGAVKMSPLEAIEKEAEGISQSLILTPNLVLRSRRAGSGSVAARQVDARSRHQLHRIDG